MTIPDLTTHAAGMSATGAGALAAAWFTWRLWQRIIRTVITCLVVGVVVYLAFPDLAHHFMGDDPAPAVTTGVQ
jgi:hypothetical protein